jgi:outer membrane immunogenic protein
MPAKAPYVAPVPLFSWTGFYLGANVGGVSGRSSISDDPATTAAWLGGTTTSANGAGVIGGFEAGYNWQLANVVLGIEGDVSFSSLSRSVIATSIQPGPFDSYGSHLSTLATLRGRFGWAFDRTLIYATGGAAFANLKDTFTDRANPFTAIPGSSVTGWTVGGGIEYAFTDHWSAKAEYLHVGFPTRTANDSIGNGYAFDFKDSLDIGRAGINYKF